MNVRPIVGAAASYLRQHPKELVRAVRGALGLRVGVPVDALRWLSGRPRAGRSPRDLEVEPAPPGLRLSATLDLMGNEVRASAVVCVEQVSVRADALRVELRLSDVSLRLLREAPDSPVATLIKSGALDLSRPGNLAAYMPRRPAMLVEAADDRVVLDFKKHRKLAGDARWDRALALLEPLVQVRRIHADDGHLDVEFEAFPGGLEATWSAVRRGLSAIRP
jgi:hypothetical protein